jgi:hypothetical protein
MYNFRANASSCSAIIDIRRPSRVFPAALPCVRVRIYQRKRPGGNIPPDLLYTVHTSGDLCSVPDSPCLPWGHAYWPVTADDGFVKIKEQGASVLFRNTQ